MSTAGASILAVGYLLPVFYLIWSLWYGKDAGPNPWGGTTLEWETPSPPPTENFDKTPVVTRRGVPLLHRKGARTCRLNYPASDAPGDAEPRPRARGDAHHAHGARRPRRSARTTRSSRTSSTTSPSRRRPASSGCGRSSPPRSCSSAAPCWPTRSTATTTTTPSPPPAELENWRRRRCSTPFVLLFSSLTRRPRGPRTPSTGNRKAIVNWLLVTIVFGPRVHRRQGATSTTTSTHEHLIPGAELRRAATSTRRALHAPLPRLPRRRPRSSSRSTSA